MQERVERWAAVLAIEILGRQRENLESQLESPRNSLFVHSRCEHMCASEKRRCGMGRQKFSKIRGKFLKSAREFQKFSVCT